MPNPKAPSSASPTSGPSAFAPREPITLSDGVTWHFRPQFPDMPWRRYTTMGDEVLDATPNLLDRRKILTASDHRKIADVLDPPRPLPESDDKRNVCNFCGAIQIGGTPAPATLLTTPALCRSTARSVERLRDYFALRGPLVLIGQEAKLLSDRCKEVLDRLMAGGENAPTSEQLNEIHNAALAASRSVPEDAEDTRRVPPKWWIVEYEAQDQDMMRERSYVAAFPVNLIDIRVGDEGAKVYGDGREFRVTAKYPVYLSPDAAAASRRAPLDPPRLPSVTEDHSWAIGRTATLLAEMMAGPGANAEPYAAMLRAMIQPAVSRSVPDAAEDTHNG